MERRSRERADVHWQVRLIRDAHQEPVVTDTENLSPDGFYCLSSELFVPGEYLECHILVPTHARRTSEVFLNLQCLAQVVRVEPPLSGQKCGLACRIEAYRVLDAEIASLY